MTRPVAVSNIPFFISASSCVRITARFAPNHKTRDEQDRDSQPSPADFSGKNGESEIP
jgi:hypothetical protein